MKKISVLLCGIGIACALTGCGSTMPELTQEENDLITEYAVEVLLKYDKNYNSHLVDLPEPEEEAEEPALEEEMPPAPEEEKEPESVVQDTTVVDATEAEPASSIEEFYGISGFSFQYTGYDLKTEYPEMTDDETAAFFAMEATPGTQLLILKFQAVNQTGVETELNMLNYGMRMRVTINSDISKSALSTMLLNDLQTYKGVIGANEVAELVAVVEVPTGISVENISVTLRNDTDRTAITLQ